MKQRVLIAGFGWVVVVMSLGCGMSSRYAARVIHDARAQIISARAVDAQNLAAQALEDAQQMFAQAESALHNGETEEAYRLGRRANLAAKVAESLAIANRMEEQARKMEKELELNMQTTEKARRELEQAKMELEQLRSTPEQ
jgi:flagellar biosynthesis GTPase FlhF